MNVWDRNECARARVSEREREGEISEHLIFLSLSLQLSFFSLDRNTCSITDSPSLSLSSFLTGFHATSD